MSDSQIAWLVGAIVIGVDVAIKLIALVIVPRNRRPQTALAWILGIFLLPYLGMALFLLLGSARLPRARRKKQAQINAYIERAVDGLDLEEPDVPDWLRPITNLNQRLGALPLLRGNRASVFDDDTESLAAMILDIERAKREVHVEFFILALDETTAPFFDALADACDRGVVVRVLLDHLGSSPYPGYSAAKNRLTEMGALWHLMLPFKPLRGQFRRPDLRNHRKLVVVDGNVGWTGSRNLIDPSYQKKKNLRRGLQWKDFMARFEGPVVTGIDAIFATDWYCETDELLARDISDIDEVDAGELDCQVVPSGPGFEGENNLRLFNSLVYSATERVIITSPYFVPDDSMLYAITTAAQSGIDVQLFVGEIGDQAVVHHAQRSYYEALLTAGVRIWLYNGPTILHAKHLTIDNELSVIGSSNIDMRSFSLDLEISVMVYGESFTTEMRAVEERYRQNSRELTIEEWSKRTFFKRVLDNLARLTATVQ